MVLSKLSKLPGLETSVAASLTRAEFDELRKEDFQEIRDEITMQKERLSTMEEQINSGSGTSSGEGISNREKNQICKLSFNIWYGRRSSSFLFKLLRMLHVCPVSEDGKGKNADLRLDWDLHVNVISVCQNDTGLNTCTCVLPRASKNWCLVSKISWKFKFGGP